MVDVLFIVDAIVCGVLCVVLVLLFSTLCHFSVESTLVEKREQVDLLLMFFICHMPYNIRN